MVVIFGPASVQNSVLATFIGTQTGLSCRCDDDIEAVLSAFRKPRGLILWDFLGNVSRTPEEYLGYALPLQNGIRACLFNVPSGLDIERKAIIEGLHGVFFQDIEPDHLLRGIGTVMSGELWFSRQALASCLNTLIANGRKSACLAPLTMREREILVLITSGASNEDIAEKLCISQNTVKTHAYNIYAKIGVENRIQAALWAAKNL